MPVPQPISSTTGADRPNQASVSSRGAGPSASRACMPSSGHSRSQVACWPPESVERLARKLVTRGCKCGAAVSARSRAAGDIRPGRMHPSMVAHQGSSTRIVVQIDTQQLPSAGTGDNRSRCARGGANICDGDRVSLGWAQRKAARFSSTALTRFAEQSRNPRLTPIIAAYRRPAACCGAGARRGGARRGGGRADASRGGGDTRRRRRGPARPGDRRGAQARGPCSARGRRPAD